jgi:RNA polymerase sigma-54 factor
MKSESTDRDGWDFDRIETQQPTFKEILRDFGFYILDDDQFCLFEVLLDNMDDLASTAELKEIADLNNCTIENFQQ